MLSADAVYASAIANATTVHDTALSDAETNYTSQITTANAGFDTAKAASVSAYESALAAYTGDLSTLDLDPFDFNVGSPVAEVSLPADRTLPIAPRPRPNFTGPSFNFDDDASFQSESAADDSALQAAKNSASAQRRTKDQEALDAFNEEVSSQNESSNTAREAISDEFASDLEEEPETNLNDVHNTYNEGVQAAETNYHASIQSASNALNAANLAASQSVTSSYNSNQATYNSAVIAAASAFSAALNADPPPSAEDVKAARGAYAAAVFAAGNQRDSDNAVASHAYAIKTIEAYRTHSIAHVNANKTIANAIRSLVNTYEKELAQHAFEVSQIHSAANAKQSQSNTDLNRDTTKAIADARKAYQKSLSENLHEESIAIETAIANHWVDTAETVRDAIQRWQLSAPSPWTAYQLDLAENRLSLAQTLKTSHLTYSLNLANAERTKSFAKANAEHARAIAWADEQHVSASAQSTTSQNLRNEQAGSDLAASKKLSDDRAKLDEDMGAAIYAHDIAAIESQRTYSITLADANLAYTQSMISARRIDKGVRPSAAASAGAAFGIAQNNAYRTLVKDQTNQSATLAESMRTTWLTYSGAQQEAEFDRRLKIAQNTLTYKNATSDQSHTSIVSLAQTEADYQKAIYASTLVYVQAVAPTDKVYSDEYVLHSANATVEDAEDLKKFYTDEATAHQTVIDLWNSSQGTRWSQIYADQAAHDFQWAMDVGIAEVKYAKDMRTHETTKQNALSDVAKGLRLDTADAVKIRDDAFAGQTVTFVTNIAGAKNDASEVEADVESLRTNDTVERERKYANEERAFTLSHANRSANAEKAYQMAIFSANISYSNAEIQASADLDGSIGDAWEDYYDDVISDTELQAAIDDAIGAYNTAMSTATDDYNDAGREATDDVREARQDLFASWVEHRSKNVWLAQAKDISSTEVERVESLGASQRDLAQAILDAVKAFANSRKESLNDFVTKMSGFDAPAETKRTMAMNAYEYDSTFTAYAYDRSIFDANAEKKKDDIASRGNYEVAWFNDEVALRTAMIGSGDPLAGPKKDVAASKAAYVDGARVAQNNYESQLSSAGFGRLRARQDAELVRIAQSNAADLAYVNGYTPAYATFTINAEKAANILAAAKTISEAEYDYAITVASADENDSIASATANRDEAINDANDNRATKIRRAHTNFFNSEADQPTWTNRVWTDITSANYGYYGHYGYGYSYGGWGGYYGYGYYGYGNYGYGGWNYSGYGYGGLGYGYGYGWGRHYGWGNIWGYGASYIGQVDSESSDTLNDEIEQAQDEFEEDAKEANVEFITAKADAEITRIGASSWAFEQTDFKFRPGNH